MAAASLKLLAGVALAQARKPSGRKKRPLHPIFIDAIEAFLELPRAFKYGQWTRALFATLLRAHLLSLPVQTWLVEFFTDISCGNLQDHRLFQVLGRTGNVTWFRYFLGRYPGALHDGSVAAAACEAITNRQRPMVEYFISKHGGYLIDQGVAFAAGSADAGHVLAYLIRQPVCFLPHQTIYVSFLEGAAVGSHWRWFDVLSEYVPGCSRTHLIISAAKHNNMAMLVRMVCDDGRGESSAFSGCFSARCPIAMDAARFLIERGHIKHWSMHEALAASLLNHPSRHDVHEWIASRIPHPVDVRTCFRVLLERSNTFAVHAFDWVRMRFPDECADDDMWISVFQCAVAETTDRQAIDYALARVRDHDLIKVSLSRLVVPSWNRDMIDYLDAK